MNNSKIVFLINDSVRAVMGIYELGQKPTLFKTLDSSVCVDDLAVVQSETRHEMTVVKIVDVDVDVDFDASEAVRWVVQRIDAAGFNDVLRKEKQAISAVQAAEHRRKREELRASLFRDHEEKLKTLELSSDPDFDEIQE